MLLKNKHFKYEFNLKKKQTNFKIASDNVDFVP